MRELRLGVIADVTFDLLPVIGIGADTLAVAADRQQAAKVLHVRHHLLQVGDAFGQPLLQGEHPRPDVHPGAQLVRVERLGQVVVGACVQAGDQVASIRS